MNSMKLNDTELRLVVFSLDALEKYRELTDNEYSLRAKIEKFLSNE